MWQIADGSDLRTALCEVKSVLQFEYASPSSWEYISKKCASPFPGYPLNAEAPSVALLEAVRGLRVADPDLGVKLLKAESESLKADEELPTTYQCGVDCPANPGAWKLHPVYHKRMREQLEGTGGWWCGAAAETRGR